MATWMQVQTRFIEEQDETFKCPLAVVHEVQVEREEPLEPLGLFLQRDHADVLIRFLDFREEGLAICTKLNPVIVLPPTTRDLAREGPGCVLKVQLSLVNDVLIPGRSLLNQFV